MTRGCSNCKYRDNLSTSKQCTDCVLFYGKPNWTPKEEELEMVNLVFVKFNGNSDKSYLFKVPNDKELNEGDKVYVETTYGESLVTCSTYSFKVDLDTVVAIKRGLGLNMALKYVIGQAVEKEVVQIQTVKVLF